jgi:hypothetical protein
MLYSALAEVDGALLGADETLEEERTILAKTLVGRTAELMDLLQHDWEKNEK